jgi:hypothetical protein
MSPSRPGSSGSPSGPHDAHLQARQGAARGASVRLVRVLCRHLRAGLRQPVGLECLDARRPRPCQQRRGDGAAADQRHPETWGTPGGRSVSPARAPGSWPRSSRARRPPRRARGWCRPRRNAPSARGSLRRRPVRVSIASPPTWKSGSVPSQYGAGWAPRFASEPRAEARKFPSVRTAPFGRPVVPEVKRMTRGLFVSRGSQSAAGERASSAKDSRGSAPGRRSASPSRARVSLGATSSTRGWSSARVRRALSGASTASQPPQREEEVHHRRVVRRQQRDPVSRLHAPGLQCRHPAACLGVQLTVGPPPAREGERRCVRSRLRADSNGTRPPHQCTPRPGVLGIRMRPLTGRNG